MNRLNSMQLLSMKTHSSLPARPPGPKHRPACCLRMAEPAPDQKLEHELVAKMGSTFAGHALDHAPGVCLEDNLDGGDRIQFTRVMSKSFRSWEVDQAWLSPASVHDFVPQGHMAHFVRDAVREALDMSPIPSCYGEERGKPHDLRRPQPLQTGQGRNMSQNTPLNPMHK